MSVRQAHRRPLVLALLAALALLSALVAGSLPAFPASADEDAGTVGFVSNSLTVTEGEGPVYIQLRRSGGNDGTQTATLSVARTGCPAPPHSCNVSGTNLLSASPPVDFPHGGPDPDTRTIDADGLGSGISITNDGADSGTRVYTFTIVSFERQPGSPGSGGNGSVDSNNNTFTLTVLEDDGPPTYSFSDDEYEFDEDDGNVSVAVIRAGDTSAEDTVVCRLTAGTAESADVDGGLPQDIEITFEEGDTQQPCAFSINSDGDSADETIELELEEPSSGFSPGARTEATVTIIDDDGPGVFQFTSNTFSVTEGTPSASLTFTRTGGATGSITVTCTRTSGSATPIDDFTAPSQVILGQGVTSGACTVPIINDLIMETSETATFQLSVTGGATLGSPSSTVLTINDNDSAQAVRFSAEAYSVDEDDGSVTITVQRTGGSSGAVSVSYATSDGTADAGVDYVARSGTLNFGSGDTSETFTISVIDDAAASGSRTVNLTLSNPSGLNLGTPSTAVLTIFDDELATPVVTGISPVAGPVTGGTAVMIEGVFFEDVLQVLFGDTAAPEFEVVSEGLIIAESPDHGAGAVDVRVITEAGLSPNTSSDNFLFTAGPIITELSPDTGPTGRTTFVDITGINFSGVNAVTFDGVHAQMAVLDADTVRAATPANLGPGPVDVLVGIYDFLDEEWEIVSEPEEFTFTGLAAPPAVSGLSPKSIAAGLSGVAVTITGQNFASGATVTFGGVAATDVEFVNETTLIAVAPSSANPAIVDVVVTTIAGSSPTAGTVNDFTYTPPPGSTIAYTLTVRWSALTWAGRESIDAITALRGLESPDNAATNDVSSSVTAIYEWTTDTSRCAASQTAAQAANGCWLAFFPAGIGIPGANDFDQLRYGRAYWFASTSPATWTVMQGP